MNPIAAIKRFIERHIVRDTTPSEDACESCRELHCDERMAAQCGWRQAIAEAKTKEQQ